MADSSVNAEDTGYAYDAAWNTAYRTNNGVWVGFTNNSLNELTSFGSTNCTYDANGNRSTLTSGSAYYLSFGYDDENRLTRIEDVINAMFRTDFVYDGLGRLRQRLEYTNDSGGSMLVETLTATWALASETRYLYDGNRVIHENFQKRSDQMKSAPCYGPFPPPHQG